MDLLSSIAALVVFYLLWSLAKWIKNYQAARTIGFPIYLCPVNPQTLLWMIFAVPLRPLLRRYLPRALYNHIRSSIYGWEFLHRHESTFPLGSSFTLVSPGHHEVWITDPEIASAILIRRKDFLQARVVCQIMGLFGPNIVTADGEDWARQRKVIAPVINEKISKLVWKESTEQAQDMVHHFTKEGHRAPHYSHTAAVSGITTKTIDSVRSIAINVLAFAGYGVTQPWKDEEIQPSKNVNDVDFMEAITSVVNNLIVAVFISTKLLFLPFLPMSIRRVAAAKRLFPAHAKDMFEAERNRQAHGGTARHNFLSVLAKLSEDQEEEDNNARKSGQAISSTNLSEEELSGNLFQFTLAGFDTTANTMAYTIVLLAVHPEWQEWIFEEIESVSSTKADMTQSMDYEAYFPSLKRCLALMHEVLRLYTPVPHITRETATMQEISTPSNGRTYRIPPETMVYISVAIIHVDRQIWGSDALDFRPDRWLNTKIAGEESEGADDFLVPAKGTFLPWSAGPRSCPGMKMAQVEFVAVMATVFRRHRVDVVIEKGEDVEMARERLKGVLADSQPRITLQMNRPREVKLRWVKR